MNDFSKSFVVFHLSRAGISLVFSSSSLENKFYPSTGSGQCETHTNQTHKHQPWNASTALKREHGGQRAWTPDSAGRHFCSVFQKWTWKYKSGVCSWLLSLESEAGSQIGVLHRHGQESPTYLLKSRERHHRNGGSWAPGPLAWPWTPAPCAGTLLQDSFLVTHICVLIMCLPSFLPCRTWNC